MADLVQTRANVRMARAGVSAKVQTAGEAGILPGMPGYEAADGKFYKAGASTQVLAAATGIFQGYADEDDGVLFQTGGTFEPGATLTVGTTYGVSSTTGAIAPIADIVTSGHYPTILGIAETTEAIPLAIVQGAAPVP